MATQAANANSVPHVSIRKTGDTDTNAADGNCRKASVPSQFSPIRDLRLKITPAESRPETRARRPLAGTAAVRVNEEIRNGHSDSPRAIPLPPGLVSRLSLISSALRKGSDPGFPNRARCRIARDGLSAEGL